MSEVFGGAAIIGGGIVGNAAMSSIMKTIDDNEMRPFYDWRNYFKFPGEYTELIDMMLISYPDRSIVGNKLVVTQNRNTPGIGKHYFYNTDRGWFGENYITFNKVYNSKDSSYYYMCYVSNGQMATTFSDVMTLIFSTPDDKIRTISLEKSRSPNIYSLFSDKFYDPPKAHQLVGCRHILNYYEQHRQHCNVILCGYRGSGKSYTLKVVAKEFVTRFYGSLPRAFDDFDPLCPGVSYLPFIKQNITEHIPAIVLIDEIDECFEKALEPANQDNHSSFYHAQNRRGMLGLLDMMGDTRYSINIMTTELRPDQLYANENWRSFIRKGRVDMFLHYVRENNNADYTCNVVTHEELEGNAN